MAGRRKMEWNIVTQFRILSRCFYILIVLFYGVWFRTKEHGINLIGRLEGMILRHLIQWRNYDTLSAVVFPLRVRKRYFSDMKEEPFPLQSGLPPCFKIRCILTWYKIVYFCNADVRLQRWVKKVTGNYIKDGRYTRHIQRFITFHNIRYEVYKEDEQFTLLLWQKRTAECDTKKNQVRH
jgi:hypothetical protein